VQQKKIVLGKERGKERKKEMKQIQLLNTGSKK